MVGNTHKCYRRNAVQLNPHHTYSTHAVCILLSLSTFSSGSCPARLRYSMALSIRAEWSVTLPSANALDALAENISARLLR